MSDIANTLDDEDSDWIDSWFTSPHPLAQRLDDTIDSWPQNNSATIESAFAIIGDPSVEGGTNDLYFGGFKKGLPHGNGILLTIISKFEGYDSKAVDAELKKSGRSWATSDLYQYFLSAGVKLHETEFPFLALEGNWDEGNLIEGNSFLLGGDNQNLPKMVYSGTWKQNQPNGAGMISYPGAKYLGGIEFGRKHGFGVQTADDGRVIEGVWSRGLFHGFMKFKKPDGNMFEQEYYNGEENGPRLETTYEDGEKIFSVFSADVENIGVVFTKFWDGSTPLNHYIPRLDSEAIFTSRTVAVKDFEGEYSDELSKKHESIMRKEGIENVMQLAPHKMSENWIHDQSEYVVKNSEDKILGWIKFEGKANNLQSEAFIVFPDLSYFQGGVGEGLLPNGQGTYTFPGKFAKISGDWSDGHISKGGVYVSNKIIFYGEFSNGETCKNGEYYMYNESDSGKKIRRAKTNKEKDILRNQLIDRVGSDIWSREKNFVGWNSKLLENLSSMAKVVEFSGKTSNLIRLISSDESQTLEFKSSVWASYNRDTGELIPEAKKNLNTEDSIIKTIAGFCNSDGGNLIIGVQDRPEKRIIGVDADFLYSGKQKDIESFQNSLSELIRKATGQEALVGTNVDIKMEEYEGHKICNISVEQTQPDNWVWVSLKKHNKGTPKDDVFFVRTGPQTTELSAETAHIYRKQKEASKS